MSQTCQNDVSFIKDGGRKYRVFKGKTGVIKVLALKVCKIKNPICGYDRQICPSGHCLAPSDAKQSPSQQNCLSYPQTHDRLL